MSKNSAKNYTIIPGCKMGLIQPEHLCNIARVTQKYNIPMLKITSAQRLAFIGMDEEDAAQVWEDLGYPGGPQKPVGIHYIQACPGTNHCKYGRQDSLHLGDLIRERFMDLDLPAKTKIGVSGCPMNCTESYIRDLGIFGKKNGWTVIFGGNGGGRPRIGDVIGTNLSTEEALELAQRCLQYYASHAKKKERTARFMERIDLDAFINAVQKDQQQQ